MYLLQSSVRGQGKPQFRWLCVCRHTGGNVHHLVFALPLPRLNNYRGRNGRKGSIARNGMPPFAAFCQPQKPTARPTSSRRHRRLSFAFFDQRKLQMRMGGAKDTTDVSHVKSAFQEG